MSKSDHLSWWKIILIIVGALGLLGLLLDLSGSSFNFIDSLTNPYRAQYQQKITDLNSELSSVNSYSDEWNKDIGLIGDKLPILIQTRDNYYSACVDFRTSAENFISWFNQNSNHLSFVTQEERDKINSDSNSVVQTCNENVASMDSSIQKMQSGQALLQGLQTAMGLIS